MIAADQPVIFDSTVRVVLSSREDGNLKFGQGDDKTTLMNRRYFLKKAGIDINHASLVGITYETDDFTKYRIVEADEKTVGMFRSDSDMHVDALVVTRPGHALFLPVADCVAAVVYDPIKRILMVSHLGRHSAEQFGAKRSVEYLRLQLDVDPADLLVWMSPSVGESTYPLTAFADKSLQQVVVEQFKDAGVAPDRIEVNSIDTAHDENYYSHSQFLKGNESKAGRFAVVAMMMPGQGEPAL